MVRNSLIETLPGGKAPNDSWSPMIAQKKELNQNGLEWCVWTNYQDNCLIVWRYTEKTEHLCKWITVA